MTRHTFATKAIGRPVLICQCPQCKGRAPEPRDGHTAELFPRAAVRTTTKPIETQCNLRLEE